MSGLRPTGSFVRLVAYGPHLGALTWTAGLGRLFDPSERGSVSTPRFLDEDGVAGLEPLVPAPLAVLGDGTMVLGLGSGRGSIAGNVMDRVGLATQSIGGSISATGALLVCETGNSSAAGRLWRTSGGL